jgi:uncharacterized protein (DUF736 family)
VDTLFSPPRGGSSRTLALQKSLSLGSFTGVTAKRFRAISADERSGIARGTVLEAKPKENIMTAIGYVTKQADGRYKGHLRTVSIRAEIDILPNLQKNADSQPDFRVLTQGIEIGAGWTRKGETSGKDYVSLAIAAPEFGPKRLYANLGKAAGSEDEDLYAVIWNPGD